MAGEIRDKMAALRAARANMVSSIGAKIDAVTKEMEAVHQDGLAAVRLPEAELGAYKQEIQDIRAEFAPLSNGDPNPGPLPDSPSGSETAAPPSVVAPSRPSPNPHSAVATVHPTAPMNPGGL